MDCAYCEEHGLVHQTSWGSWLPNQSRHAVQPMNEQLSLLDPQEGIFHDRRPQ